MLLVGTKIMFEHELFEKEMVRWNYERDACEFLISRAIVDFQKI